MVDTIQSGSDLNSNMLNKFYRHRLMTWWLSVKKLMLSFGEERLHWIALPRWYWLKDSRPSSLSSHHSIPTFIPPRIVTMMDDQEHCASQGWCAYYSYSPSLLLLFLVSDRANIMSLLSSRSSPLDLEMDSTASFWRKLHLRSERGDGASRNDALGTNLR